MDRLTLRAYYVYNLIFISKFDYDRYYGDLLKNALKYGMSRNDFWYGDDYKDYFLYEEAYLEKLHEQTHIQGYYNYIAFNVVLSNAFMDKKKGDKPLEYPKTNIYTASKEKRFKSVSHNAKSNVKITKDNLNEIHIYRLLNCY